MSGRRRRAGLVAHQSRTRGLIESGLLDKAAQVAELAHSLTDAAVAAMEAEWSRRRALARGAPLPDLSSLRGAVFEGIAHGIINRVERRGR